MNIVINYSKSIDGSRIIYTCTGPVINISGQRFVLRGSKLAIFEDSHFNFSHSIPEGSNESFMGGILLQMAKKYYPLELQPFVVLKESQVPKGFSL